MLHLRTPRLSRENAKLLLVAVGVAVMTTAGPSVANSVFAANSDKVDGKDAISATTNAELRRGKLVATSPKTGLLPNNIIAIAPNSAKLGGLNAAAFAMDSDLDGLVTKAEVRNFVTTADLGAYVTEDDLDALVGEYASKSEVAALTEKVDKTITREDLTKEIAAQLETYAKKSDLNQYVLTADLQAAISSRVQDFVDADAGRNYLNTGDTVVTTQVGPWLPGNSPTIPVVQQDASLQRFKPTNADSILNVSAVLPSPSVLAGRSVKLRSLTTCVEGTSVTEGTVKVFSQDQSPSSTWAKTQLDSQTFTSDAKTCVTFNPTTPVAATASTVFSVVVSANANNTSDQLGVGRITGTWALD